MKKQNNCYTSISPLKYSTISNQLLHAEVNDQQVPLHIFLDEVKYPYHGQILVEIETCLSDISSCSLVVILNLFAYCNSYVGEFALDIYFNIKICMSSEVQKPYSLTTPLDKTRKDRHINTTFLDF